ncbi:MAG TPA: hypothetical protein PKE29_09290 [Phycisphaerales bacterium]|nr:hypothetical protein [Phycisphaerales bacterium]
MMLSCTNRYLATLALVAAGAVAGGADCFINDVQCTGTAPTGCGKIKICPIYRKVTGQETGKNGIDQNNPLHCTSWDDSLSTPCSSEAGPPTGYKWPFDGNYGKCSATASGNCCAVKTTDGGTADTATSGYPITGNTCP